MKHTTRRITRTPAGIAAASTAAPSIAAPSIAAGTLTLAGDAPSADAATRPV